MDNVKNDSYYVQRLKSDLEFIVTHMRGVDIDGLNGNEILLDSMLFRMIQISENVKRLSDNYKQTHCNIPWNALSGLRNRIVHDYGNVDLNIVYETFMFFGYYNRSREIPTFCILKGGVKLC